MESNPASTINEKQRILHQLKQEKINFFTKNDEIQRLFGLISKLGFLVIGNAEDPFIISLKDPWLGYKYGIKELVSQDMYRLVVDMTKKMGGTEPYKNASEALANAHNTFAISALIELSRSGQKASRDVAKYFLDHIDKKE